MQQHRDQREQKKPLRFRQRPLQHTKPLTLRIWIYASYLMFLVGKSLYFALRQAFAIKTVQLPAYSFVHHGFLTQMLQPPVNSLSQEFIRSGISTICLTQKPTGRSGTYCNNNCQCSKLLCQDLSMLLPYPYSY